MATPYNITRYSDWNPLKSNFEFKKPRQNQHGSNNIGFNYNGARMYLKTPKMRVPFGLSRGMNDVGYNLQLTFDKENEAAQELFSNCEEFDRTMIEAGMENAFEWGITPTKSKKPSRDVIESKYNPMVKYPKYPKSHPTNAGEVNPNYPPYLQVQLPQTQGKEANPETGEPAVPPEFVTELYDKDKNFLAINEDNIPKQCHCSALLYATSVYTGKAGYGVSWRAAQAMVFPRGGLPTGTCLIDDDEVDSSGESEGEGSDPEGPGGSVGEGEGEENTEVGSGTEEPSGEVGEEGESAEPAPEPEPSKKPMKPTRRSKKQ